MHYILRIQAIISSEEQQLILLIIITKMKIILLISLLLPLSLFSQVKYANDKVVVFADSVYFENKVKVQEGYFSDEYVNFQVNSDGSIINHAYFQLKSATDRWMTFLSGSSTFSDNPMIAWSPDNNRLRFGTNPTSAITSGFTELASIDSIGKMKLLGSIQIGTDTTSASVNNVGTIRYRADANNSWMEMVMQTGASAYSWVVIKTNTW